jgi:hypothetical protein
MIGGAIRPAKTSSSMETRSTALRQTEPGSPEAITTIVPEVITEVRFRRSLSLAGLLLTPVAAVAGTLAAWRFGVDAGWTNAFFVANGFLSHWQVWCAFAISIEGCAWSLGRVPATTRESA